MAALNVQVGYPIVPLSELIPVEEFSDTISTMSRYLPKIMVEAGIVSSTSEVRRNRPDLCKMYPDDMTTCEEIKWGKKRLYVVVGKKTPTNFDDIWKNDENVYSWQYHDYTHEVYTNSNHKLTDHPKAKSYWGIPIVTEGNIPIVASGKEYTYGVTVLYCG